MNSNIWFTSDMHLGHANIIRYSNRPFNDIDEMNAELIRRWNSVVGKDDVVYHLGDFTLTSKIELVDGWLIQLNGKIRIIRGNHDAGWLRKFDKLSDVAKAKIHWIRDYYERGFDVEGERQYICMMHFPLLTWHQSGRGSIMCHGHMHGNGNHLNVNVRRIDVGSDCHNWYPIRLVDVVNLNKNKPLLDHHDV